MQTNNKTILVSGATGKQGGAVARQLLAKGWNVRALTREPDQPAAQHLAQSGAEICKGNLNEAESVTNALKGIYGAFSVQTFIEEGTEGEVRQGKNLAQAAKAAGLQHFVYSSVAGSDSNSGIPHFESKWKIEQHLRSLELPFTVFRPVFFMDNFNTFSQPIRDERGLKFSLPLHPSTKLQMIAVDDIAAFVTLAFERPHDFLLRTLEIAGDHLSMPEVAEKMSRKIGETVRFVETPLHDLKKTSPEMAVMFEWFNQKGYQADIPTLKLIHPELQSFQDWLQKQDWQNQKFAHAA